MIHHIGNDSTNRTVGILDGGLHYVPMSISIRSIVRKLICHGLYSLIDNYWRPLHRTIETDVKKGI